VLRELIASVHLAFHQGAGILERTESFFLEESVSREVTEVITSLRKEQKRLYF